MHRTKAAGLIVTTVLILFVAFTAVSFARAGKKKLIAHRGASAYAPEHTLAAYQMAIEQGADYVEQDLQITKDGVLVCLHDLTLERTTNVKEIFPDRARSEGEKKHWYVSDFTLAEIKQLDAGSWFAAKYQGAKVPTFQEAIDLVRGRAGLYPETKGPEVYDARGFEMEKLVLEILRKNKLDKPGADKKTPIVIQSFSPDSLRRMRFELKMKLPLVLLISAESQAEWLNETGLRKAKIFATGIGPNKALIDGRPELIRMAHSLGLTVTPWTFRSSAIGRFKTVQEEMRYFLYDLGVDEVFTDNPDQFPTKVSR